MIKILQAMSIIAPITSKVTAFFTLFYHYKILLRSFTASLAFEQNETKLKILNQKVTYEKPVDAKIDNNFSFDEHIKSIYKSASSKLGVVARATLSMKKESRILY